MTASAVVRAARSGGGALDTDTGCGPADGDGLGAAPGGRIAVTASSGLTRPLPVPGPVPPFAVTSILFATAGPLSPGNRERTSAATPDTNAAAKLVPLRLPFAKPPGQALVTFRPGAVTATREPRSENGASEPSLSTAPTDSTPG